MIDQFGNYVPEWQNFGDDEQEQSPDMGPFAQALKNRFASKKPAEIEHGAVGRPAIAPHIDTTSGVSSHEIAPMKKGFGGEGMKSL
jgi:hypothetical protein